MIGAEEILKVINNIPVPSHPEPRRFWKLVRQGEFFLNVDVVSFSCFFDKNPCVVIAIRMATARASRLEEWSQYMKKVENAVNVMRNTLKASQTAEDVADDSPEMMTKAERNLKAREKLEAWAKVFVPEVVTRLERNLKDSQKLEVQDNGCARGHDNHMENTLSALNAIPVPDMLEEQSVGWRRGAARLTGYFSSRFFKAVCSLESCKVVVKTLHRQDVESLKECVQYVKKVEKVLEELKAQTQAPKLQPCAVDQAAVDLNMKLLTLVQQCEEEMGIGSEPDAVLIPGHMTTDTTRLVVDIDTERVILMRGLATVGMGTVNAPWMSVLNPFIKQFLLKHVRKFLDYLGNIKNQARVERELYDECLKALSESE